MATISPQPNVVQVMFCHDLEDGWYEIQCPKQELNGQYANHRRIERLAKQNGWAIKWIGDQRYNPWREKG